MSKLPEEISELVQWMGALKSGPLRMFLQLDTVIQNLHVAATATGQLEAKHAKLADSIAQLQREEAEWKQALQTIRDKMTEEQEHGRTNIQAFRDERTKIQCEADARLAATQDATATASGELTRVQREVEAARHDLAAIKGDVAKRLKQLQDVAT